MIENFLEKIKNEEIDLEEFLEEVREKILRINKEYECFVTIPENFSLPRKKGKIFGLPVSVKDNICTKDIQTTAGSKILEGYIPPFNATVIERILEEGGVIIGKTCMDEFGFGTFSTNCAFGIPKNPFDKKRSCGGSSGGSACITTLADFPHVSLAESTGGSISCPASFCGCVGLTPTYGLVSRFGLIDYASSLDKIGVMGKNVYDVALILSIISGKDERDSTSLNIKKIEYTRFLNEEVKRMKVGIPVEYFTEAVDEKIKEMIWRWIKKIESELNVKVEEISLPYTKYALASYYLIATSEASTNLARYCGMRYGLHLRLEGNYDEYFSKVRTKGFGEEAKRRITRYHKGVERYN